MNYDPTTIAIAVALSGLVVTLIIGMRLRKARKARAAGKPNGVTVILLRGGSPLGGILTGCVFVNGQYVYDAKSKNPQLILYDGRYVRNNPHGEPFMFYDVEKQCVVGYGGECHNDDDVTLVYHDGTAKDVSAKEAEKFRVTLQRNERGDAVAPADGQVVFRKHPRLWQRLNGARLFAEKETMDWANIQNQMPTWLTILNRFMPILVCVAVLLLIIILVVVVV